MGRRKKRSRFVPVPGTAPVTRSRSRAVGPGLSREPGTGIAPTITEEAEIEPSGSQSTTSGRQRHSSAPSRPAVRMPTNPAQKLPPSASTEAVPDSIAAYVPNSPIRKPHLVEYDSSGEELCGPYLNPDPELYKAYKKAKQHYSAKIAKLMELPTLDEHISIDPEAIQETAGDTILKAAKFVLGLSSYIDGVLLRKCSGILIEWNKGNGTILTTARLICSRSPNVDEWLGGREYALKAEVHVQLLHMDDTDAKGKLVYLDKQYDFALISVPMDLPTKLACFSDEVKFGQDVILLGRDKWHLKIANGKVLRNSAGFCDHHHLMYTDADIPACGAGGAVIDFKGDVIGMLNCTTSFIPSSTILKCLHLWRTFNCVPRIHLGMKFFGIEGLNLASKETISRKYNVDAGLIVLEVSGGSTVEKLGVRMGDIVQAVNGKHISATVELENMLLDICKVHLEDGVGRYSDVDVMVVLDVFNTTKRVQGRIQLRAKLSHDLEIITRGEYRISARDICTSI